MGVVYFDQLLGAVLTQKLVELLHPLRESTSFCMLTSFEEWTNITFLFIFTRFVLISGVKSLIKV